MLKCFKCKILCHWHFYFIAEKKVIKYFLREAHNLKFSKDLHLVHLIQAKLIFVSVLVSLLYLTKPSLSTSVAGQFRTIANVLKKLLDFLCRC